MKVTVQLPSRNSSDLTSIPLQNRFLIFDKKNHGCLAILGIGCSNEGRSLIVDEEIVSSKEILAENSACELFLEIGPLAENLLPNMERECHEQTPGIEISSSEKV